MRKIVTMTAAIALVVDGAASIVALDNGKYRYKVRIKKIHTSKK